MRIPDGFILLARKLETSEIWTRKPAEWLKIWLHLMLNVTFKTKGKYLRGTGYFAYQTNDIPGISKFTWHRCLHWLQREKSITCKRRGRGLLIIIELFDEYQNPANYKNGDSESSKSEEPSPSNEYSQEFLDWYHCHPVQAAIEKAWRAWKRIVLRQKKTTVKEIMAGQATLLAAIKDGKQDPDYIPHPATWLNNGCWADTYQHKKKAVITQGQQSSLKEKEAERIRKHRQRDMYVQAVVDRLWEVKDDDEEFQRQCAVANNKFQDFGKNKHGETIVEEALALTKYRREHKREQEDQNE